MQKRRLFLIITFFNFGRQTTNPANICYYPINQNSEVKCPPNTVPMQLPPAPVLPVQPPQVTQENKPVKVTTKITEGPSPTKKNPLDSIIDEYPELVKTIKSVFEYNGIADPWPQFTDILNANQHKLPDPCMLFTKMKNVLKVYESLKEMISDEMLKIETFIKRAKSYLAEDQEILKRDADRMGKYMKKIKESAMNSVRTEYAKKFTEVYSKAVEVICQYKKLKKWLESTLKNFKILF